MKNLLKNYNLEKKCILITGAAGLLGKQFSTALLEAGAKVIITDVDKKALLAFKKKLFKKYNKKKIFDHQLDVSSESSIKNVLKKLDKAKIKIDVLINNACLNPKFNSRFKKCIFYILAFLSFVPTAQIAFSNREKTMKKQT